jgi:hypothetical protein
MLFLVIVCRFILWNTSGLQILANFIIIIFKLDVSERHECPRREN